MADTNEFQVVKGRKARKLRRPLKHEIDVSQVKDENEYFDLHKFKNRLNSCIQEIAASQFFSQCYDSIITALTQVTEETTSHASKKASRLPDTEVVATASSDNSSYPATDGIGVAALSEAGDNSSPSQSLLTTFQSLSPFRDVKELHLLSYGIGNFTSCMIARYQLAFLLALRNELVERCTICSVYDPVFSNHEKRVLESYNCHVILENEEGKRACSVPTIAFMPHCGKALYNNLLWRNLKTDGFQGLTNLILVGNSFTLMIERTPGRILHKTAGYVIKLHPYIREVQLANTFTDRVVFNDLAIHSFSRQQLEIAFEQLGEAVSLEEPVYENSDAEFIPNNKT